MDNDDAIQAYDIAVLGGGVAATICAYTLAKQGFGVAVLAERSSLMHEIGLVGLHTPHLPEIAEQYEAVRDWYALMSSYQSYNGNSFDPVLVQLAADRYVEEQQVDVLFETSVVAVDAGEAHDERDGSGQLAVKLAWRGGVHRVRCRYVVDCSQHAALLAARCPQSAMVERYVYRKLMTVNNAFFRGDERLTFELDGRTYQARIEPGRFGGLTITVASLCVADKSELALAFMANLEQLFIRIQQLASIDIGDLVHVGEYEWSTPPFVLPQTFERGIVATDRNYAGTGCWVDSIGRKVQSAALWDKPGVAISEQLKAGAETAMHVVDQIRLLG